MSAVNVTEASKGIFLLSGELNRDTVTEFWPNCLQELIAASQKGDALVLDLIGIKDSDTAGLAWLLNLLRDSKKLNIRFSIKNLPGTIGKLAKISDVDGFLPLQ
ncbi:MAG: phospholipid transport system transporter-binding protein [Paraglaciecola sp.]|jgi:phospholipid transport system transporter-binding protein